MDQRRARNSWLCAIHRRLGALLALVVAASAVTGCYERVVRTRGAGAARTVDVYEPNRSDEPDVIDRVEEILLGDPDAKRKD